MRISFQKIVNETITPGPAEIYAQKVSVRDGPIGIQQRCQVLLDEDLKTIGQAFGQPFGQPFRVPVAPRAEPPMPRARRRPSD